MIPVVFINCSSAPYVDKILNHEKVYETRSRNTLRSLIGKRVLIAETGKGKPVVRCSARIVKAFPLRSPFEWECFRDYTQVPENSPFDWKNTTRSKWLYELDTVRPLPSPFQPKEGKRHGRVWMEYNGRKE